MKRTQQLRIKSDADLLSEVLQWFEQLYHPSIPQRTWLECQTALAEGFINVVRHAHRGYPPETPVQIEVSIQDQGLEIKIWDQGPGFNLEQRLQKAKQNNSEQNTSGRGLLIMHDIMDFLDYSRTPEGQNCLTLIKQY
ncbi:hypothetical protein BST81_24500 [Leptolyngbya sp. 'hensonii']|uniref:ATP-binding protein n=1 Tax=Leptolyngbya sp. 'hensonii' TaxID=1922337 RepID=UPI00094F8972|nr:ATP-binding protein [Leptolyngbya sp. 'hensonii']OLP15779.1 hypothetical protein BST81_24500 [Leptolyngbya sp. 'hensonii']